MLQNELRIPGVSLAMPNMRICSVGRPKRQHLDADAMGELENAHT